MVTSWKETNNFVIFSRTFVPFLIVAWTFGQYALWILDQDSILEIYQNALIFFKITLISGINIRPSNIISQFRMALSEIPKEIIDMIDIE